VFDPSLFRAESHFCQSNRNTESTVSIVFDQRFDLRRAARAPLATVSARAVVSLSVSSVEYHRAARAHRSALQARLFATGLSWLGGTLRRAYAEWQRRSHARAVYATLSRLDTRTLHDLGMERSELTSVAAELSGSAELTRIRAMNSAR
jgi:uncharacterized protein YjiS (DUF1127 family)